MQHSSTSFKNTVKPTDPIANDKQSSGVYSVPFKRCSSAQRSFISGPPLDRSLFNEDDDDSKIRRIRSVANIQGKVFHFCKYILSTNRSNKLKLCS
jgi:hypothetical protein